MLPNDWRNVWQFHLPSNGFRNWSQNRQMQSKKLPYKWNIFLIKWIYNRKENQNWFVWCVSIFFIQNREAVQVLWFHFTVCYLRLFTLFQVPHWNNLFRNCFIHSIHSLSSLFWHEIQASLLNASFWLWKMLISHVVYHLIHGKKCMTGHGKTPLCGFHYVT